MDVLPCGWTLTIQVGLPEIVSELQEYFDVTPGRIEVIHEAFGVCSRPSSAARKAACAGALIPSSVTSLTLLLSPPSRGGMANAVEATHGVYSASGLASGIARLAENNAHAGGNSRTTDSYLRRVIASENKAVFDMCGRRLVPMGTCNEGKANTATALSYAAVALLVVIVGTVAVLHGLANKCKKTLYGSTMPTDDKPRRSRCRRCCCGRQSARNRQNSSASAVAKAATQHTSEFPVFGLSHETKRARKFSTVPAKAKQGNALEEKLKRTSTNCLRPPKDAEEVGLFSVAMSAGSMGLHVMDFLQDIATIMLLDWDGLELYGQLYLGFTIGPIILRCFLIPVLFCCMRSSVPELFPLLTKKGNAMAIAACALVAAIGHADAFLFVTSGACYHPAYSFTELEEHAGRRFQHFILALGFVNLAVEDLPQLIIKILGFREKGVWSFTKWMLLLFSCVSMACGLIAKLIRCCCKGSAPHDEQGEMEMIEHNEWQSTRNPVASAGNEPAE